MVVAGIAGNGFMQKTLNQLLKQLGVQAMGGIPAD